MIAWLYTYEKDIFRTVNLEQMKIIDQTLTLYILFSITNLVFNIFYMFQNDPKLFKCFILVLNLLNYCQKSLFHILF